MLDGRGSNPGGGRDFPPVQTGHGAYPASCTMGTGSFPGVKNSLGVLLITHPLLVPRSWKSRAISLPPSGPQPGPWRGYFTFNSKILIEGPEGERLAWSCCWNVYQFSRYEHLTSLQISPIVCNFGLFHYHWPGTCFVNFRHFRLSIYSILLNRI